MSPPKSAGMPGSAASPYRRRRRGGDGRSSTPSSDYKTLIAPRPARSPTTSSRNCAETVGNGRAVVTPSRSVRRGQACLVVTGAASGIGLGLRGAARRGGGATSLLIVDPPSSGAAVAEQSPERPASPPLLRRLRRLIEAGDRGAAIPLPLLRWAASTCSSCQRRHRAGGPGRKVGSSSASRPGTR